MSGGIGASTDSESKKRSEPSYWEIVKFLLTGAAAAVAFWAKQDSARATQDSARATQQTESLKVAINQQGQRSQFDIKAYELVEQTLTLGASAQKAHGIAAAAIVNALTLPPLRDELQNALQAGLTDSNAQRRLADARRFDAEGLDFGPTATDTSSQTQSSLLPDSSSDVAFSFITPAWGQPAPAAVLTGYRIDILYCEASSPGRTTARQKQAKRAYDALTKHVKGASLRVRLLPRLVQARPEYQVFADEVRPNDTSVDREAAGLVADLIGIRRISVQRGKTEPQKYMAVLYCGP
jgi:hypothetical protein